MRMDEVTAEQASAANQLINTASWAMPLIALIGDIPAELAGKLSEAHDAAGYCCSAHSEGLECCLDILLDDPGKYASARIAEAQELFSRYQDSQ